ncbi:hypothetical protein ISX56_32105 [Serratia ureilytica]|nr:hypothetical protein [Serratia ureilytica]
MQHYTDRTPADPSDFRQPFRHLPSGRFYRWALFAEGPGRYTLALVGHHLVIDGASSDEFFSLVSQYYGQQRRIRHRRPALREDVEHLAQAIDILAAAAHAPITD